MTAPDPISGQVLGHYRVLEQIGAGGMGVIYRAHDEHLDCDVALKVLPPGGLADDAARKRFRKEALALSKLSHPNIAVVHDFDTQDGTDFLVQELIPGLSLSEMLISGPLPEREIVNLGLQLAEGLAAAHEQSVIHRDLKPANIRVTPDARLKILDFGLAVTAHTASPTERTASQTQMLSTAGTLPYMAPEQLLEEKIDARTDIWALGCVLYEMATGRRAFLGSGPALVGAILHQSPPAISKLNPKIGRALEAVIQKCLDRDPEKRYHSAREIAVDLRRAGSVPSSAGKPLRWRRWLAVLAVAIAVTAAVGIGMRVESTLRRSSSGKQAAASPRIHSLAVLPLANLSGDPNQEYFVDGMHEELIATLGKIGSLRVISRTSVMQYKEARAPLPKIAQELGVDAVVEGSVRRVGDQVRITVRLTEAATDRNRWANSYQRKLRDVLALQSDVARAIAQEIQVAVTPEEETRLAKAHPVNADAHDAYLKGRYYWNKRTITDLEKALEYFKKAVEIDPDYALGYAGLADCYYVAAARGFLSPKEAHEEAESAAKKALQLDDLLAEPHASLGGVNESKHDWLGAEREFRRAIELNPSYATAHHWYALYLAAMGRQEEAMAQLRRARELDPFSLIINEAAGWPFYLARQYDQAIEQYQRTLQMDPNFLPAYHDLGLAYLQKGMVEEAISVHLKLNTLSGGHPTARAELCHTYAVAGRKGAALRILNELKELSKRRYVSTYDIARIYVGLGEKDQAIEWLEKASEERNDSVLNLKVDPNLDPVRSEPRFQYLIRRLKFPP